MEKQGGMAFGFWKTATAVIKPESQLEERGTCHGLGIRGLL
jgi:hypothetical protein